MVESMFSTWMRGDSGGGREEEAGDELKRGKVRDVGTVLGVAGSDAGELGTCSTMEDSTKPASPSS
jgi:hypothetical protein